MGIEAQVLRHIQVSIIDALSRERAGRGSGGLSTDDRQLVLGVPSRRKGPRAFQSSKVDTSSLFAVETSAFGRRSTALKNLIKGFQMLSGFAGASRKTNTRRIEEAYLYLERASCWLGSKHNCLFHAGVLDANERVWNLS